MSRNHPLSQIRIIIRMRTFNASVAFGLCAFFWFKSRARSKPLVLRVQQTAELWETALIDPACDFDKVELIFGYGSLTWKPPCEASRIIRAFPAVIRGYHRRFWMSSVDHRGTAALPGLVATILHHQHPDAIRLKLGPGEIAGMVFQVRGLGDILPDLDAREKNGYTRTLVPVYELATPARKNTDVAHADGNSSSAGANSPALGEAVLYLAQPGADPAYTGPLADAEAAALISRAVGPSGRNIEYLSKLQAWCRAHGVDDPHVENLVRLCASDSGWD